MPTSTVEGMLVFGAIKESEIMVCGPQFDFLAIFIAVVIAPCGAVAVEIPYHEVGDVVQCCIVGPGKWFVRRFVDCNYPEEFCLYFKQFNGAM